MSRQSIAQLRAGASITKQPYLLRDKSVSTTRTGSLMLRVTVADRSGALPGVLFDVPTYVVDALTPGRGVLVTGRVGEFRQQTQINIERIEPTELVHLEEYLPMALRPRDEMELEFAALCDGIESPQLAALIKQVFDAHTSLVKKESFTQRQVEELRDMLYEWTVDHIMVKDKRIAQTLNSFGGPLRQGAGLS